jgi:hypothetical protein
VNEILCCFKLTFIYFWYINGCHFIQPVTLTIDQTSWVFTFSVGSFSLHCLSVFYTILILLEFSEIVKRHYMKYEFTGLALGLGKLGYYQQHQGARE